MNLDKDQANTPESDERDNAETLLLNESEGSEVTEQRENGLANGAAGAAGAQAPKAGMPAMPWIVLSVIAVAALAFVLIANPLGKANEKIAEYDGGSITKADFYDEVKSQAPADQFNGMVDSLIEKKLIQKLTDKAGIKVSDADINAEVAKYEKNFGGTAGFQQALDQNGLTLDTLKQQQIVPTLLKTKLYAQQHPAKEEDFKAYYDANKDKFATTPKQIKASHILVSTQAEADAILAELKAGKDFATLAKAKSIDKGSAVNGGDLGDFFGPGAMVPEFEQAAFALKKGEISGVVQSQYGFHIIKVTDIKEAVVPAYDSIKADVEQAYWQDQLSKNETDWVTKLKADNNVKSYVEEQSAAASPSASPDASAPAASEPASPEASPAAAQ
jgi:foldase protein PrsA